MLIKSYLVLSVSTQLNIFKLHVFNNFCNCIFTLNLLYICCCILCSIFWIYCTFSDRASQHIQAGICTIPAITKEERYNTIWSAASYTWFSWYTQRKALSWWVFSYSTMIHMPRQCSSTGKNLINPQYMYIFPNSLEVSTM